MNDLRKAAEMALEALEDAASCVQNNYLPDSMGHDWDEQIEALRQALDDKPNYCVPLQSDRIRIDPVTGDVSIGTVDAVNMSQECVDETAKGEHKWVGLTDEDIAEIRRNGAHSVSDKDCMAIEAKLKEKNSG